MNNSIICDNSEVNNTSDIIINNIDTNTNNSDDNKLISTELFIANYDSMLDLLETIFKGFQILEDNNTCIDTQFILTKLKNQSINEKLERGYTFNKLMNDKKFVLFSKCKIKTFSFKTENNRQLSNSLFGSELSIRNLLNNQKYEIKQLIWQKLFAIYIASTRLPETFNKSEDRILILNDKILKMNRYNVKSKISEICGCKLDKNTEDMMNDIIVSFEQVNASLDTTSNPIANIIDISKNITDKYYTKINNGEIDLTKIVKGFAEKIPGLDNVLNNIINTENTNVNNLHIDSTFSTADIEVHDNIKNEELSNIDIGKIMKLFDNINI